MTKMTIIERTQPMWMHKRLVIQALELHPEDLSNIFPGGTFTTAREAIEAMQEHKGEWFVDGRLLTEAEANAERANHPI